MSATPDSKFSDPEQRIADLERQLAERDAELAECKAERDECKAERDEALAQQTAIAEVLQVINSSPGDLAPVFGAILEKAHTLCGVTYGALQLYDGEHFRVVATRGIPEPLAHVLRKPSAPQPGGPGTHLIAGAAYFQIPDIAELVGAPPDTISLDQIRRFRTALDLAGIRTMLFVPLRKDKTLLGGIVAGRKEVCPFTEKQIALLQNFAAQAVIAMENARLITETREALEQQTATAEVLGVINSSPGDLAPVFDAMLEKAICFCQADEGILTNRNGDEFEVLATRSGRPEMIALNVGARFAIDRETVGGRVMLEGRTVHIRDVNADPDYRNPRLAKVQIGTLLGVPLLREGVVVGSFNLARERIESVGTATMRQGSASRTSQRSCEFVMCSPRPRTICSCQRASRLRSQLGTACSLGSPRPPAN